MNATPATTTLKKRDDVLPTDRWDVEALFQDFDQWKKAYNAVLEQEKCPYWPSFSSYKGRLTDNVQTLQAALILYFTISRELEKLYVYAHLRHDEEVTLNQPKGNFQTITSIVQEFRKESSWFEPEILSIDPAIMNDYLQDPTIREYQFFLEKILRKRAHTLTQENEELAAMALKPLQTSSKAFSALNNADLKFANVEDSEKQSHTLSHGLYQLYLRSSDRVLRKNAFETMHKTYDGFENTFCELLYGQVNAHLFDSKAHHFNSCLDSALFPHSIPTEVYRNLINTVRSNLGSLHRYTALRKKRLGVDKLHLYDMYTPLVSDVQLSFEYEEAEDLVIRSVAPLGTEYQEILRQGLKEKRWVDRFENENKRSGAYSSGCFDSHPYILMNYRNSVRDTFTLAHEAGHSMHSYLSHRTQPYQYADYPIFVAEVASTFNEELLMDLLMKELSSKEQRLFLINEKLENMRATLFRQTMFAEFELKIHELVENNTPFTSELLKEIYIQLNKDYFGPSVEIDPSIAIEWARIPHFYYNFYVYQYATGISAALNLADKVLNQAEKAKENYLTFLSSGSTLFPIDLLKIAGVDLTRPTAIEKAIAIFDSLVTELEKNF